MPSPAKAFPLRRVNWRLLLLLGIVVLIIGWVLWIYVQTYVTGGIIDRGSYLEVDLKAISLFEMDQANATDESIPRQFRALDGQRVLLIGEMYQPFFAGDGEVSKFDLVYSIAKCCVTASPKIQHFVKAAVMPGRRCSTYSGLVKVIGTFHVGVQKAGGRVSSIYRIDVESVQPWS